MLRPAAAEKKEPASIAINASEATLPRVILDPATCSTHDEPTDKGLRADPDPEHPLADLHGSRT